MKTATLEVAMFNHGDTKKEIIASYKTQGYSARYSGKERKFYLSPCLRIN